MIEAIVALRLATRGLRVTMKMRQIKVANLPKRLIGIVKSARQIGMYNIVCGKFEVRMPLLDSVATEALTNSNNHAIRQLVLHQFIEEMSYVEGADDFKPPELYQFNRLKIERVRDVTSRERKKYLNLSLRTALVDYIDSISGG